uniref:Secretagogin, EF-hand calcium binding protein n=1 Tax=Molossus molossus TaxID=27622 RepID=A0A7J8CTS9_MOLMO|nr:secretagogin, EF-hand calcium binding protein [Molossus molossus]
MDSASGHTLGRWEAGRSGSALTLKSPWLCCGSVMGEHVQKVKKQFMAARDVPKGGRIWTEQLVSTFLSEDGSPLDSSVQLMQAKLSSRLRHHQKTVAEAKLEECTGTASKTRALKGPEVDRFVKDMMELVQPSIRGVGLGKFRGILLCRCDVNQDGKAEKTDWLCVLG